MKDHSDYKPETKAIHSESANDVTHGSVSQPIYLSTNFLRAEDGSYPYDYIYSRIDNPNRKALEASLAELEGGEVAVAFSSGMAATTSLLQTLKSGDHIILPEDAYYSTIQTAQELFQDWGLKISIVDPVDLESVRNAICQETKLIWLETPSNPQLRVCDISSISKLAHEHGAICAVDNTWATPVLQRPLELGADVVMHSTTKYIGGHGDVTGGVLVLKSKSDRLERLLKIQSLGGAVPSPFDCWLLSRGLKTLHVRLKSQMENALALAEHLDSHPAIEKVHYPGLLSHPQHQIAAKQMTGFGAMLSVQVKGDAQNALSITGKLKLFVTATSLGGVESLVEHRKSIEGDSSPTPDNLLRLSVGLEHINDLISDWDHALS